MRTVIAPPTSPVLSEAPQPQDHTPTPDGAGEAPSSEITATSLAPPGNDVPSSPPKSVTGSPGASEDFSRSHQLALLSLLKGDVAEQCIAGLRQLGATGPTELDYLTLVHDGLAAKGPVTGALILTPRGRLIAGHVAVDVAHRTRVHRAVFGINQGTKRAYFRCSCGAHQDEAFTPQAYRRVRGAWSLHRETYAQRVKTAASALGTPGDQEALLSAHIKGFVAATHGKGARNG